MYSADVSHDGFSVSGCNLVETDLEYMWSNTYVFRHWLKGDLVTHLQLTSLYTNTRAASSTIQPA